MYVIGKNARDNTVELGGNDELLSSSLTARDVNLISVERLDGPTRVTAKIRYNQSEQAAVVSPLGDGRVKVDFDEPQRAVAPGQAVVFFSGETVVGGGTIES